MPKGIYYMASVTLNMTVDVELVDRQDNVYVLLDGQLADVSKFQVYLRRYNYITQKPDKCVVGNKLIEWRKLGSYTGPLKENTASVRRMSIKCGKVVPFGVANNLKHLNPSSLVRLIAEEDLSYKNIFTVLPMLWVEDPDGPDMVLAGEGVVKATPILPVLALEVANEFCPRGSGHFAIRCAKAINKARSSGWFFAKKRLFVGKCVEPLQAKPTDRLLTPDDRRHEIMASGIRRRVFRADVDMKMSEAKDAFDWLNTSAQGDLIERMFSVYYEADCKAFDKMCKDLL